MLKNKMKMKSKKSLLLPAVLVCILALASFCMTGCGGSGSDSADQGGEKTKLTFVLDWTPNTNHTGIYVAQELGYFEEAGLDVEIVQPPDDGAEAMVGSGQAQFGVSFQDYMPPALQGETKSIPITAVAAVIQHNTSGIMSAKGKGITSPAGMEGKKYATWELPIEQATIRQCMENEGADFDKVKLIPEYVDDEVAALKTGRIDCVWVYYAWAAINAQVKGFDFDYFAFRDIDEAFDYYSPVIIANDQFLEEDPDTAKAFLDAVSRGYEYAIENPDEAADLLLQANPELDEELVKASQEYLADQYQADADQWGVIDGDRWNRFFNWLNDNELVEEPIPEDCGFTNDYLPQAK